MGGLLAGALAVQQGTRFGQKQPREAGLPITCIRRAVQTGMYGRTGIRYLRRSRRATQ